MRRTSRSRSRAAKSTPAKLIGSDPRTDVALIKVTASGKTFPYVEFSNKVPRVGDWVLAVGNPFGLGGTVTAGIVSAHKRDIGSGPYDYLQIDAAVNRGNSGGPSFDLDGKVVGMNTAIFSPSGGNVGIAFAVPFSPRQGGCRRAPEPRLRRSGLAWRRHPERDRRHRRLDRMAEAKGAMITKVTEDGPAAKEDLKAGDVIVEVNGEKIDDSRDLARTIAELNPATDVNLSIVRYGEKRDVTMKLGTFPSQKKLAALEEDKPDTGEQMKDLGLSLAPATKFPGAGEAGVVITEVDPASDAADKGLKPGDVILEVAGVSVSNPSDVAAGVKKAMDGAKAEKDTVKVLMQVKTGDQTRFIALSLKKAAKPAFDARGRCGSPHRAAPAPFRPRSAMRATSPGDAKPMRVLVIEDDQETASFLGRALKESGHVAEYAGDGQTGLDLARANAYDVLIVDRMLPKRDGLAVIGALRAEEIRTPALILSALGEVDDRVKGLRAGGDDYLTKPYAFSELLARIEALARRKSPEEGSTRLVVGDLVLDRLSHKVTRAGDAIILQPREFRLLEYLMKHAGQVVTRTMLLENVWDYHFDPQTNVIDVHISRLRSKIDKNFGNPLLHTVRGAGYSIRDSAH